MSSIYRNNHYVPTWYQKRFLPSSNINKELYYLDLEPNMFIDQNGNTRIQRTIRRLGFKYCFVEKDLYTTQFGKELSTIIEQTFFGNIDLQGKKGIEYFANFDHTSVNIKAFHDIILYMSTQKLRTPKGLNWLSKMILSGDKDKILNSMISLRKLYCAIWAECIWLIADASQCETKFIISDHPISVYNRKCGLLTHWCQDSNDPAISMSGTHTIFPLSLDKILILTNLSWVRNPYQSPKQLRPNPKFLRTAIFNFTDIQTRRYLTEKEVLQINFIIKSRSLRYIAAAKEEWLFPEKYVLKSQWSTFGEGYLLMPDPRAISLGGEILITYENGTTESFDEYGRRPWEKDYGEEHKTLSESKTLYRFKGEFARLYGPYRRGRAYLDNEKDDERRHCYHIDLEDKNTF